MAKNQLLVREVCRREVHGCNAHLVRSFDMEDAMILNKSSVERGMFHGCVYKTKVIDAAPSNARTVRLCMQLWAATSSGQSAPPIP